VEILVNKISKFFGWIFLLYRGFTLEKARPFEMMFTRLDGCGPFGVDGVRQIRAG
jgi:hypothetical protein